tara:strand:+ start:1611 stop:1841 length:231 start_codon:yes stop_codon:yes gene_type:complete
VSSFIKRARKLINENQDLFIALEDLDYTGRLSKVKYKNRYNFTLDQDLMNKLRNFCKKQHIKMSNFVEDAIRKELK